MAEVLGVVASGIAVGQAVATLGRAISAVKRLCGEVNEIPDKIAHLLEELEILDPIVADVENGLTAPDAVLAGAWNDAAARRAVASCQLAASALENLASSLQARISAVSGARRKVASLRAVLKKEELALLERRLESAIRVLMVAQNCQLTSLVKSQPELIAQRLEATVLVLPAEETKRLPVADIESDERGPASNERVVGFESGVKPWAVPSLPAENWPRPQKTGQVAFRGSAGGFQLRVVSPAVGWAVRRSWELLVSRSYLGWKFNIQPFIHSPDKSLLISLAKQDAVDDLSYLVESGQANLRHDPDLLNDVLWAAYYTRSVSTAQWLIWLVLSSPSSSKLRANFATTTLIVVNSAMMPFHMGCGSELDRVLSLNPAQYWRLDSMPEDISDWSLDHYDTVGSATWYVSLITVDEVPIATQRRLLDGICPRGTPLVVRLCLANSIAYPHYASTEHNVEQFKLFASQDGEVNSDLVREAAEADVALFPGPVYAWSYGFSGNAKSEPLASGWDSVLRNNVTLSSLTIFNNHLDIRIRKTPLLALIRGVAMRCCDMGIKYIPKISASIQKALLHWVQLLIESGVDVVAYGQWETRQLRKMPRYWDHPWCDVFAIRNSTDTELGFLETATAFWTGPSDHDSCPMFHYNKRTGPMARLQDIVYGPKPEDWRFVWETYEDEWPGQFWKGVDARIEREEALRSRPPGAWIDEVEETEPDKWDHD
ncbi:hypothetical protein B0T16DRAFT_460964 [Cercophora newfieldiana]|uniref:Uncharacterized protein n=1 Tax=Cercophora newfieldiana TaxID=92897 RepID=A0AA40CJ60_9PEZI|nr:hypothetical protein B0T16DRAFT_460964 [Cercophora newfieldiana]